MLTVVQTANGHNPFEEVHCPLCENTSFTSIDHASVWCDHCNAQFFVRPTAGDFGYVLVCVTEKVWGDRVQYPELLGKSPTMVQKIGEYDTGWTVPDESNNGWLTDVREYANKKRRLEGGQTIGDAYPDEDLLYRYVQYREPKFSVPADQFIGVELPFVTRTGWITAIFAEGAGVRIFTEDRFRSSIIPRHNVLAIMPRKDMPVLLV